MAHLARMAHEPGPELECRQRAGVQSPTLRAARSVPNAVADISSSTTRNVLVIGVILLWVFGLLWVLHRKGIVAGPRSDESIKYADDSDGAGRAEGDDFDGEEPISEIVIKTGPSPAELAEKARLAALARSEAETEGPEEDEGPPTYPVWFESVRDIGVCKISYEGGSKTANLHVDARLPEGMLAFSYQCGSHRGRGSIDVKSRRVNGVLFCETAGGVAVKTVRRKDARCANR